MPDVVCAACLRLFSCLGVFLLACLLTACVFSAGVASFRPCARAVSLHRQTYIHT